VDYVNGGLPTREREKVLDYSKAARRWQRFLGQNACEWDGKEEESIFSPVKAVEYYRSLTASPKSVRRTCHGWGSLLARSHQVTWYTSIIAITQTKIENKREASWAQFSPSLGPSFSTPSAEAQWSRLDGASRVYYTTIVQTPRVALASGVVVSVSSTRSRPAIKAYAHEISVSCITPTQCPAALSQEEGRWSSITARPRTITKGLRHPSQQLLESPTSAGPRRVASSKKKTKLQQLIYQPRLDWAGCGEIPDTDECVCACGTPPYPSSTTPPNKMWADGAFSTRIPCVCLCVWMCLCVLTEDGSPWRCWGRRGPFEVRSSWM